MFDRIEKLKREYTDKYVIVDGDRPELARFAGYTGQVKTVNMSGRALVQFEAWNNIGWYDIDVDFLTVVPKPEPGAAKAEHAKPAKAAAAKPAAGEKKMSAAEMARAQGAAKPAGAKPAAPVPAAPVPAGAKKASTADILAAARAGKAAAGGTAPAKTPAPAGAAAKPEPGKKLSTAEILAASRAKKGEAAPQPVPAEAAAAASHEPDATPHVTHEVGPEAPLVEPAALAASTGALPTTTAEKVAWCRQHDANRAG